MTVCNGTFPSAAALLTVALGLTLAGEVTAQGGAILRSQSRFVERAITKNVEQLFKPRLRIREGATGPVTALGLSADERYLVTAVGNHSVLVWDLLAPSGACGTTPRAKTWAGWRATRTP